MDSNVTLSDIAAVTGGKDGMFGGDNGGMWIFALLILLLIGNGGLFGGNSLNSVTGERVATQADIQRAVDFDTLKSSISGVNETVLTSGANTITAIKDAAYQNLSEIRDNGALISNGNANIINNLTQLQSNMQSCCCDVKSTIMENRYLDSQNAAAIMANSTANAQKILDKLNEDRIGSLEQQVQNLQLQNAVSGVVRYPMQSTYCSGSNPFCGCGNSCGCSAI